ncbi:MAG: methylated-DNA--[protein]-cysteine S-methyltransferase [Bdellovibrionales bacterium]|nr:methylated-DNA--[protein]-cysteine S-methyltransferase [Bdellovibrionales bacterium]
MPHLLRYESPIGTLHLAAVDSGLCQLTFSEEPLAAEAERLPANGAAERILDDTRRSLDRYFGGSLRALDDLPLALSGTSFQQRVWNAVRRVEAGRAISYGALASRLEEPNAARAVGTALGKNPVCLVVPCHRVLGAGGKLGGFSGGLNRKRFLLNHEGVGFADI